MYKNASHLKLIWPNASTLGIYNAINKANKDTSLKDVTLWSVFSILASANTDWQKKSLGFVLKGKYFKVGKKPLEI